MNELVSDRSVRYIANIESGREVTLVGAADSSFWEAHLAEENLSLAAKNGRAEIIVSAVRMKWAGVDFSELSVSVCVVDRLDPSQEAVYLIAAFNTSRVFSWVERMCFHTPYRHARVELSTATPWSFALTDGPDALIHGQCNSGTPPASRRDFWEGRIFLPASPEKRRRRRRFFFAKLRGEVQTTSFSPASDLLALRPNLNHPVVQLLVDSRFSGNEWRVRTNAAHSRSKTYNVE